MDNNIIRYPVQHPLLKKYIAFFWELHIDGIHLNHKIIPQRNINLRFNLSDTRHYSNSSLESPLEDIYFLGLQDQFANHRLKMDGNVDVLGISFHPDGFYPFIGIPVSEFRNQLLGADEIGFKAGIKILSRLKEAQNVFARLKIMEEELLLLIARQQLELHENISCFVKSVRNFNDTQGITDFCKQTKISIRTLERLFNKYVGMPASTYTTLNRFHTSINQLLHRDYLKFSDLAYENGYFDQMHFIRDFKRFTGNTPKEFILQNNSLVQITKS